MFETWSQPAGAPANVPPRAPRKNVMLAASISAGAVSAPVRIRNISETGAMIDGAALPDPGCKLTLSRLEMSIDARVVWAREGRCGLSLGGAIVVEDWIAGASSAPSPTLAGQIRVDRLQAAIRSGSVLPAETRAPEPAQAEPVERCIAAELERVRRMLDAATEELIDDVDVLMRHERAMQNFDIAAQIIDELAVVMAADDRKAAAGKVHMHELRSRLSGRLTLS